MIKKKFIILLLVSCLLNITLFGQAKVVSINQNQYLYYDMNNISNGIVVDKSGNGRDAVVKGNPTLGAGVKNNSLIFNGQTDYLDTGERFLPTGSFSISAWFISSNRDSTSELLIGNNDYTSNGRGFEIGPYGKNNGNYFRCAVFEQNGIWYESSNKTNRYADNQWHNIILVFTAGSSLECFMDGKSMGKTNLPSSMTKIAQSTANLIIGSEGPTRLGYFEGAVDELQIFSETLTSQEIQGINNLQVIKPVQSSISVQSEKPNLKVNSFPTESVLAIVILGIIGIIGTAILLNLKIDQKKLKKGMKEQKARQKDELLQLNKNINLCIRCKEQISREDKFCQNCGAPVLLLHK